MVEEEELDEIEDWWSTPKKSCATSFLAETLDPLVIAELAENPQTI